MANDETMSDYDAAEYFKEQHPRCEECDESCCPLDDNGLPKSCVCADACDDDFASPVYDAAGRQLGYVHARCREAYLLGMLQEEIESALKVRLPFGMEPWAVERSRNLAMRLFFAFDVKPKGK